MKKITFLFGLVAITLSSFAQVGINITTPDSSAVLDLNSSDKGLLIPRMTKTEREAMQTSPPVTGLADGLLVYDTDYKRFYFWDNSVSKWLVLNNWRKEYTSDNSNAEHVTIMFDPMVENGSNVGIGQLIPNSKLTVNGNLTIGSNIAAPTDGVYIDGQVRIGSGSGNTEKLEVDGNSNTTGTVDADEFVGRGVTPIGGIIMYSGATDGTLFTGSGLGVTGSKMEGWAICNGSNGTPNLRGRFIVGSTSGPNTGAPANASDIDKLYDAGYNVDGNGDSGENTHTLAVGELPSHKHSGSTSTNGNHSHNVAWDTGSGGGYHSGPTNSSECASCAGNYVHNTDSKGNHSHNFTTDNGTGGNGAHENRPPFYAVYYIMRIN